MGISQSSHSGSSVSETLATVPVRGEGSGSVVKALTALQALQLSALIALTFQ